MNKCKVGDKVKWNDGVYHNDNKRIDIITNVLEDSFGGTMYMTREVNHKKEDEAKLGKAAECYLVLAEE